MTNEKRGLKSIVIMRTVAFVIILTGVSAWLPTFQMPIRYSSLFSFIFYMGAPTIYIVGGIGMFFRSELSRKVVLWATVIETLRLTYVYLAVALSPASMKNSMPENMWIQTFFGFVLNGAQIWLLTRFVVKAAFQRHMVH